MPNIPAYSAMGESLERKVCVNAWYARTMHASFFRKKKRLWACGGCVHSLKKNMSSRSCGGIVAIETEMKMMFEFGFIGPPSKKYTMMTLGLQSEVCRL